MRKVGSRDLLSRRFSSRPSQKLLALASFIQRAGRMTLYNPGILKYLEALMFMEGENRTSSGWKTQLFRKGEFLVSGVGGCVGAARGAPPTMLTGCRTTCLGLRPCSVGNASFTVLPSEGLFL